MQFRLRSAMILIAVVAVLTAVGSGRRASYQETDGRL